MTEISPFGRADRTDAASFSPTKAPRERLVSLHIDANPCPQVFARILHLVTGSAIIPVDILIEYGAKTYGIEILFDRDNFNPSRWFLGQIEGVPAVKSADFFDHRGAPLFPAKAVDEGGLIAIGSLVDAMDRRGGGRGVEG